MRVLVVGSNGQLGQSLKSISSKYNIDFSYTDRNVLDITNQENVASFFENAKFDFCLNCSAYTAVDKAEEELELANKINVLGVSYLAEGCKKTKTTLIHISTDFVFNGKSFKPYSEEDITQPISVYGQTKLDGEKEIQKILGSYYIIRTSWLYSEFGNNFMKSMLSLSKTRNELSIVSDQIGTPTYAVDLAKVIIHIIESKPNYGLYHYSNLGVSSWYDFSKAIFEYSNIDIKVNSIPSKQYLTPAKRPFFSVLDKTKIQNNFNLEIPYWRESLKKSLKAVF
jgi:dTDP-4-dehydrorhamnose reductase